MTAQLIPPFSILIPVYNEEAILASSVADLQRELAHLGQGNYEIWLCENGSRDQTRAIAESLAQNDPRVKTLSVGTPGNGNYGKALREGMVRAANEYVICFEIDFWNTDFIATSIRLFGEGADLIIASKQLASSHDQRGPFRKFASNFYNIMLRLCFGFRGTETHGVKSFRKSRLLPIIERCVTERDVFATEFVLRAERAGLQRQEVPIAIRELRPQRVNLWKRVPHVLRSLWILRQSLRLS